MKAPVFRLSHTANGVVHADKLTPYRSSEEEVNFRVACKNQLSNFQGEYEEEENENESEYNEADEVQYYDDPSMLPQAESPTIDAEL